MIRVTILGISLSLLTPIPVQSSFATVIAPLGRTPVLETPALPAKLAPVAEEGQSDGQVLTDANRYTRSPRPRSLTIMTSCKPS